MREVKRLVVVHRCEEMVIRREFEMAQTPDGAGLGAANHHEPVGIDVADTSEHRRQQRIPLARGHRRVRLVEQLERKRAGGSGETLGDLPPYRDQLIHRTLRIAVNGVGVVHREHDGQVPSPCLAEDRFNRVEDAAVETVGIAGLGIAPPTHWQPHRGEASSSDVVEVLGAHPPAARGVAAVEDASQVHSTARRIRHIAARRPHRDIIPPSDRTAR